MRRADKHLEALRSLLNEFDKESGDVVIGRMLPELAALMVTLSEELDNAQRKVVRLTWAIFGVTLVLAFVALAQLVVAFN